MAIIRSKIKMKINWNENGIEIIENIEKELNELKAILLAKGNKEKLLKTVTDDSKRVLEYFSCRYVLEYLNKENNTFMPLFDPYNNQYEFYDLNTALDYINKNNFLYRIYIYDKQKNIHRKTIKQGNKWIVRIKK